jgi:hypothetical protein
MRRGFLSSIDWDPSQVRGARGLLSQLRPREPRRMLFIAGLFLLWVFLGLTEA